MSDYNVNDVLSFLEGLSKRVDEHNRKEDEVRGFKKARIQSIVALVDELKAKGIDLGLELDGETDFTRESLGVFREKAQEIISGYMKKGAELDAFFKAVESGDIEAIKKYTNENLDEVDYTVELSSIQEMKEKVAETNEQILTEGVSGISPDKSILQFDLKNNGFTKSEEQVDNSSVSGVVEQSEDTPEVKEDISDINKMADDFGLELGIDNGVEEVYEEVVKGATPPTGSKEVDLSDLEDEWGF